MSDGTPTQYYDRFVLRPDFGMLEIDFFYNAVGMAGSTYAVTNLLRSRQLESNFIVDGIVLHCNDESVWYDSWFDLCVRDRPVVRVNTRVSRMTGRADIMYDDRVVINANDTFRATLRWASPKRSMKEVTITAVIIGRSYSTDKYQPNVLKPGVFARVLIGSEVADADYLTMQSGAGRVQQVDVGVRKSSQTVVSGPSRKFNFEE